MAAWSSAPATRCSSSGAAPKAALFQSVDPAGRPADSPGDQDGSAAIRRTSRSR